MQTLPSLSLSLPPVSKTTLSIRRNRLLVVSAMATRPQQAFGTTMYEVLSVAETAGPEEIKAAYRKLARRWHPDVCPSSGDKGFFAQQFMRVREAYEVLSDPQLRINYDIALHFAVPAPGDVVLSRKGADRGRGGFGDWESQLEGLRRRRRSSGAPPTWGSRTRGTNTSGPSD